MDRREKEKKKKKRKRKMAHFHALKQKLFLEKTPRWQCKEIMFPLPLLLPWLVLLPPFCPLWSKPSWRKCFLASVLKVNSITLLIWREGSPLPWAALLCEGQVSNLRWESPLQCSGLQTRGRESTAYGRILQWLKKWKCGPVPIYQWRVQTLLVNNFAQLNTIWL